MKQHLFISLLNPRYNCLLQYLVILIVILIFNINPISFCMDQNNNNNNLEYVAESFARGELSIEDLQELFEQINRIQNPEQILRLRQLLSEMAERYHIDLNPALYPQLQHPIRVPGGNSGVPVEEVRNPVPAIILFVGLSVLGWIIIRNIDLIRDFVFDFGQHMVANIPLLVQQRHLAIAEIRQILNAHPETGRIIYNSIIEILRMPASRNV